MFVDDLSTFTINMHEVVAQIKAIHDYALSHKCIVNMEKSSISGTCDTQDIANHMDKTGMTLKVVKEYIHLGAKYTLHMKKSHTYVSQGVKHRLSKGRAMISEMKVSKSMYIIWKNT